MVPMGVKGATLLPHACGEAAERAIEATLTAVDGITRHGDNILEWLAAQGYPLTWANNVTLTSPMST